MGAMFNDTSSLRTHLATRRSGKARDMIAPGPDAAELRDIIALALRTPDHGKLAPWRIVTVAADQRDALAALLKAAWVRENPGAAGLDLSALDQFAHQAPTLLVLAVDPGRGQQNPGVGATDVGGRGRHEPAPRRARAWLRRQLADRLGRL